MSNKFKHNLTPNRHEEKEVKPVEEVTKEPEVASKDLPKKEKAKEKEEVVGVLKTHAEYDPA